MAMTSNCSNERWRPGRPARWASSASTMTGRRGGAGFPNGLPRAYDGRDEDVEGRRIVAAAVLTDQVEALHQSGFDQFHFYTLNQANLTYAACRILGLRPKGLS